MEKFTEFARIAEIEFSDIVLSSHNLGHKLRIYLKDKSFIDFYATSSLRVLRFSIHWERRHIDKTIYRLDNTPDKKWKKIETFPIHFHHKNYIKVIIPSFTISKKNNLGKIFRDFLNFVRNKLKENPIKNL